MEASYAYPSAQSLLQSQGLCQICGSNGYIISGWDLKNQVDEIHAKQRQVSELTLKSDMAKEAFNKTYSSSDVDGQRNILENLKKDLKQLVDKKEKDTSLLNNLEIESNESRKLLQQSKRTVEEKEQLMSLKKTIAADLRQRLKELSNVLFLERMKRALAIFKMMSIVVAIPTAPKTEAKAGKDGRSVSPNPRTQQLAGCSSILSLPLPNNGIYSDIPYETTAVALSHVAHLVDALSSALNIPLTHPIVTVSATECMISPHYNLGACYSLSPVTHINTRAKHESFNWLTPVEVRKNNSIGAQRKDGISQNIDLREFEVNRAFPQALTLLQANVVALCLRAGLPPDGIWPPQAILLNLHELLVLCAKCVKRNSAPPSQSILHATSLKRSSVVDLPTNKDILDDKRAVPAVPLVYQQQQSQLDPVVEALTQRYSSGGSDGSRSIGTVTLPVLNDEDEIVMVEREVEEPLPRQQVLSDAEDVTFVTLSPHPDPVSVKPSGITREIGYDEDGYGLNVVEEEYDMLDLLLESQMLAEESVVDTNNENELMP